MRKVVLTGMGRGLKGRCPQCGGGRLFRSYLKVEAVCSACGHANDVYRVDDFAPWATILLVGHIVLAPAMALPAIHEAPLGWVLAVVLGAIGLLTLLLLPRVKGAGVGLLWALRDGDGRQPGQERERLP